MPEGRLLLALMLEGLSFAVVLGNGNLKEMHEDEIKMNEGKILLTGVNLGK
jgi:hypothetical protein